MAELMKGKRGLVMGVANERSIAWGIARAMAAEGAELAFTHQGEAFGKRVAPLAESVGSDILVDVDVTDDASLDAAFAVLGDRWGRLDFVVHAIAFSDKAELTGHSLGATGVHEAIYSLLMMQGGFIAASANITELDPAIRPGEIATELREGVEIDSVLSNSFGFGGTNATLVFSKLND